MSLCIFSISIGSASFCVVGISIESVEKSFAFSFSTIKSANLLTSAIAPVVPAVIVNVFPSTS